MHTMVFDFKNNMELVNYLDDYLGVFSFIIIHLKISVYNNLSHILFLLNYILLNTSVL